MLNHQNSDPEENFLPGYGKKNPFAVPGGYFENLSARIMEKIGYAEELGAFAILSELKDKRVFEVPADYFKSGENALEYRQELSEFEVLAKIGKPVLKEDPDYFEAFGAKVTGGMEVAKELEEYPLLSALEKQDNFVVDPGYFDTVVGRVKERYHAEAHRPRVLERLLAHILKPGVAFGYSFILIIGAGLIYYTTGTVQPGISADNGDCHTLACLEKREMLNERTVSEMNDDNLYEMVDVDALEKQLSSDSTATGDSTSVQLKNTDSIKNN